MMITEWMRTMKMQTMKPRKKRSLCEAQPEMLKVRQTNRHVIAYNTTIYCVDLDSLMVHACLEGMAKIDKDTPFGVPSGLAGWLAGDPSTSSLVKNNSPPAFYEQSLIE
ncbi:importin subunit beta-3 [Stygiomarasmius scandens]|uniref:Importin subunit beta-3 n=1 Tax=Marasmiellus scandens TaxID=2682957 RepID=A0ABR1J8P7_9AGAR